MIFTDCFYGFCDFVWLCKKKHLNLPYKKVKRNEENRFIIFQQWKG